MILAFDIPSVVLGMGVSFLITVFVVIGYWLWWLKNLR